VTGLLLGVTGRLLGVTGLLLGVTDRLLGVIGRLLGVIGRFVGVKRGTLSAMAEKPAEVTETSEVKVTKAELFFAITGLNAVGRLPD